MQNTFSFKERMKIEEIGIWEGFVAVAKYGSFTKAAERLRLTVPQLSKRVAKLENILGVRLFQRTTRTIAITEDAKALLPKVVSALEDLQGIESFFEEKLNISGTIRITSIPFIAHRLLIPVVREFVKEYPGIQIEFDLSEKLENLVESNFDLAVRIQEPKDSSMVYRKLASNNLVLCATPKYLKTNPRKIEKPEHLIDHSMLFLSIHQRCSFTGTSHKLGEFMNARTITCDNGWFLTELALQDLGILVRSIWDVRPYFQTGKLVQVLKKFPLESFGHIYAVVPSRRLLAPRVRIFLDYLVSMAVEWNKLIIKD